MGLLVSYRDWNASVLSFSSEDSTSRLSANPTAWSCFQLRNRVRVIEGLLLLLLLVNVSFGSFQRTFCVTCIPVTRESLVKKWFANAKEYALGRNNTH